MGLCVDLTRYTVREGFEIGCDHGGQGVFDALGVRFTLCLDCLVSLNAGIAKIMPVLLEKELP